MARGVVLATAASLMLADVGIADDEALLAESLHTHTWQVWPEVSQFKYREPGFMTEEGTFFGLGAAYTYRPWVDANAVTVTGGNMLRLEGRLSFGQVDYDGSLSDGTPYTMQGLDDVLFEFRVLMGRDYPAPSSLVTPYFGLGYRLLSDDATSDPLGYRRESNYLYLPLGVRYTREFWERWLVTPAAEFDLLIVGLQASHLSDSDPFHHDVTNEQSFGYGLRGSVQLQRRFDRFNLALDPFVTFWSVRKSKVKADEDILVYEPRNWSVEYGLRFILAF
jgi:hypothetical protein